MHTIHECNYIELNFGRFEPTTLGAIDMSSSKKVKVDTGHRMFRTCSLS